MRVRYDRGFLLLFLTFLGACVGCQRLATFDHTQERIQRSVALSAEQLSAQSQDIERLAVQQQSFNDLVRSLSNDVAEMRTRLDSVPAPVAEPAPASAVQPRVDSGQASTDASGKLILGREEWVWFDVFTGSYEAELNTGAGNSVLYVKETQVFERDGADWVRFVLVSVGDENSAETAEDKRYEAPLTRYAKVRSQLSGDNEKRPAVKLNIRIGPLVEQAEFVLTPARKTNLPVVLGRNFLRDIAVVDVAKKNTQPKIKPESL